MMVLVDGSEADRKRPAGLGDVARTGRGFEGRPERPVLGRPSSILESSPFRSAMDLDLAFGGVEGAGRGLR